jgi:hypothetical protein
MPQTYEEKRAGSLARSLENSAHGRDIGSIPEAQNPARRAGCERDFAVRHGHAPRLRQDDACRGRVHLGDPLRASGLRRLIGSDEGHAVQMLDSIKTELETNDLLQRTSPRRLPDRVLEGIAHRCNGQLYKGERTHIGWTADEIVLPTIPGSGAGAIIKVAGLTGGIRGMKFKRPDGRRCGPTLVVVDDPQTDGSRPAPRASARPASASSPARSSASPGPARRSPASCPAP